MKIFSFLKWKIKQATINDWLWALGSALIGAGIVRLEIDGKYLIASGVGIWIGILFIEIIVRGIKRDYKKFVEEQNRLFDTIRTSDKK